MLSPRSPLISARDTRDTRLELSRRETSLDSGNVVHLARDSRTFFNDGVNNLCINVQTRRPPLRHHPSVTDDLDRMKQRKQRLSKAVEKLRASHKANEKALGNMRVNWENLSGRQKTQRQKLRETDEGNKVSYVGVGEVEEDDFVPAFFSNFGRLGDMGPGEMWGVVAVRPIGRSADS